MRRPSYSPKQLADLGWAKIAQGLVGGTYLHAASGWRIQHCGHPTALYPYALYNPEGSMVKAPNGRAWSSVKEAVDHVTSVEAA